MQILGKTLLRYLTFPQGSHPALAISLYLWLVCVVEAPPVAQVVSQLLLCQISFLCFSFGPLGRNWRSCWCWLQSPQSCMKEN